MQNKQQPENTPPAAYNTNGDRQPSKVFALPRVGEKAADLIYSEADKDLGGIWIYPASYDDYELAWRRAVSLGQGFDMPFAVNLFSPRPQNYAVEIAGYYAFTRHDPRPNVIYLSERVSGEEAGR